MQRRHWWILAILILYGVYTPAEKAQYVKVNGPIFVATPKAKASKFKFVFTVSQGHHVQANPVSAPNLIATTVTLEPVDGIEWGTPVYPPGKPYRLVGATSDISTYDGQVDIPIPFRINPKIKSGTKTFSGKFRYQACNDKTCFFPTTVPFSGTIKIGD